MRMGAMQDGSKILTKLAISSFIYFLIESCSLFFIVKFVNHHVCDYCRGVSFLSGNDYSSTRSPLRVKYPHQSGHANSRFHFTLPVYPT